MEKTQDTKNTSDQVDRIIDYECGLLNQQETISLFQDLVDSGIVWNLQGSYQRMAKELIRLGYITQ